MSAASGKVSRSVERLAAARRRNGVRGLLSASLRLARRLVEMPFVALVEWVTDAWLGVHTRGTTHREADLSGRSVGGDPRGYQAIRLPYWRKVISAVPLDPRTATFVDLGCGRGRALVLAARSGFRRVIGVELDEELVADARNNLALWTARKRNGATPSTDLTVEHEDAAAFAPPPGPLLVFLFNSFGPETLRRVLETLHRSRTAAPDETYFAYCNPQHAAVFDEFSRFARHAAGENWVLYRLGPVPAAGPSAA